MFAQFFPIESLKDATLRFPLFALFPKKTLKALSNENKGEREKKYIYIYRDNNVTNRA